MKIVFCAGLLCLAFLTTGFKSVKTDFCGRAGIKGKVVLVKGNQMPSPGTVTNPPAGMQTTLYIYELTNMSQVARNGESAFYTNVNSKLIKTIETSSDGTFKVKLKPGSYSLFVKKGDLFFANLFDGDNNIYPVEVIKGKMTDLVFQANYDAVY